MSDLKWNSEQIVDFLGIYKQYTSLWDVSFEDYLKRDKRQAAMQKLVTDLEQEGFGNTDIAKLKTKIKSIKDSYRFELNKVKSSMKSGAGTEDIYEPRLAWFAAADCFWKKVVLGRESTSNLDEPLMPKQTTTPSSTLQEKDVSPEPCSSGSVMKASTPQKELNTHSTLKMRPQPRQTLHKQKSPTKNKFKKSMKPTRFEANINKLKTIATLTATDPDDEYEKYGRHIAAQLRAMPLRSFILLHQDINNLITTERLNLVDSAATSSYFTTQMQRPNSASTHSSMSFEPIATNTSNTDTQCELHDECDDLILNKALINICSPASNEAM